MKSPNHALQRTAPHVTAPASAAALPPTMQVPRRAPRSLSLGSFGTKRRTYPQNPPNSSARNVFARKRPFSKKTNHLRPQSTNPQTVLNHPQNQPQKIATTENFHWDWRPSDKKSRHEADDSDPQTRRTTKQRKPTAYAHDSLPADPPQRSRTRRCSEPLRAVTAAAPTAFAPRHLSAAAAPALRGR